VAFDWFIFVAQLVNFAVLIVLLRLFLYKPVLNLMQQRQKQLDEAWNEARMAKEGAEAEAAQLRAAQSELEGERRMRLEQVEEEATALRLRRREEAEGEARAERERQEALLESQREVLVGTLLEKGAEVFVSELSGALQDLADGALEEQALGLFVSQLRHLPADQAVLLREQSATPVVTTAFAPSPSARSSLTAAIKEATGTEAEPQFAQDPSLLFGAALTVGPVRVEASGRRRVAQLEAAFQAVLERPDGGKPTPEERDA